MFVFKRKFAKFHLGIVKKYYKNKTKGLKSNFFKSNIMNVLSAQDINKNFKNQKLRIYLTNVKF